MRTAIAAVILCLIFIGGFDLLVLTGGLTLFIVALSCAFVIVDDIFYQK